MCVYLRMGDQRTDLIFSIFEQCQYVFKVFLCLFWREDHTKSCARVKLRDRMQGAKKGRRDLVS